MKSKPERFEHCGLIVTDDEVRVQQIKETIYKLISPIGKAEMLPAKVGEIKFRLNGDTCVLVRAGIAFNETQGMYIKTDKILFFNGIDLRK